MRFTDFISVKLTIALIVGILLGFWLNVSLVFSLSILLGLFAALAVTFKRQKRNSFPLFGLMALLTTTALGVFGIALSKDTHFSSHFSNSLSGKQQIWQLTVSEVLKPTTYSYRYFAQVRSIEGNKASGTILLSIPRDSTSVSYSVDDGLFVFAKATQIQASLNPHQFDYRAFLEKKGVSYQIKAKPWQIRLNRANPETLKGIASNFREHSISQLRQADFGKEELAVIQALLLGQRNDLSEATYTDYKNAGAVHILAVSGLHIGILLLILQFLLRPLGRLPRGKTLKLVLILALLWAFAFIAGLSPSIVRAVTMFSFMAYAMYLNRPTNTFNIITLSMFFILLVKPMFLFEVGFQMSYAAVFSIVWIYPKLQRLWFPSNWLVRQFWQLLSVSVAAQIGVLPISLFYFHQFPALFFVSNLVVIPFLGIILGMGVLVIVLSLFNVLPPFLVAAYNFLINTMNSVIGWVAEQEEFVFSNIPFDQIQLVLAYLLIFGSVFTLSRPKFKNIALLLSAFILLSGWSIYQQYKLKEKDQLLLVHQTKNSVLLYQNGKELHAYTANPDAAQRIVNAIQIAERIAIVNYDTLQNAYVLKNKYLFVVDSSGIYPQKKNIDHLLLTHSPKVNLERLIDSINPKQVLADGSNYKSYVQRWKVTCRKKKTPFHYTGEKGAYYLSD